MAQRKTSTSKSPKSGTGKRVTQSSGKSKKTTASSSRTAGSLKKNLSTLTTSRKKKSTPTSTAKAKAKTSTSTTKRTSSKTTKTSVKATRTTTGSTKNRGVKHTRCKDKSLFPCRNMPWRLEPRTGKFNLSWFMCFDHAVDQIERQGLKPNDYKLQCHTSVPLSDPLTGDVRIQRYVT